MLPLMKWYVTAYEMVCYLNKLPKKYATALGNRLWKRYVTAYGNGRQPL